MKTEPWPVRLLIIALKICAAMATFFVYPVIFPWLWRASSHISSEVNTRRAANRYATRQAGRQRYYEQQRKSRR